VSSSYLPPISLSWQIKGIGDFNGDGRSDLLWRDKATGITYTWLMNGAAVTSSGYTAAQGDNSWTIQGVGDLCGDGKADIVWRHTSGALYIWQMNGTAVVSSSYLPPISLEWAVKGLGDLNGDGRADILWRDTTGGATYVWLMDGATATSHGYTAAQADNSWTIE
jgi:hypothetical protein